MKGKIKTTGPRYHKLRIWDFHFSLLQNIHNVLLLSSQVSEGGAYKHPVMVRTEVSMEITQNLTEPVTEQLKLHKNSGGLFVQGKSQAFSFVLLDLLNFLTQQPIQTL